MYLYFNDYSSSWFSLMINQEWSLKHSFLLVCTISHSSLRVSWSSPFFLNLPLNTVSSLSPNLIAFTVYIIFTSCRFCKYLNCFSFHLHVSSYRGHSLSPLNNCSTISFLYCFRSAINFCSPQISIEAKSLSSGFDFGTRGGVVWSFEEHRFWYLVGLGPSPGVT